MSGYIGAHPPAIAPLIAEEVKVVYESNADTNEYDDAEQTKLGTVESGADVTDSTNVNTAGAVMESDYVGTHGTLTINSASAIALVSFAANQIMARGPTGELTAHSSGVIRTILNVADGAQVNATPEPHPYDMAFVAGFDDELVKEDIEVGVYAQLVCSRSGSWTGQGGKIDTAMGGVATALIMDVKKNGTSIFSTTPRFNIGLFVLTPGIFKTDGTEDFVAGDTVTFSVLQVGGVIPGQGARFTLNGEV